MNPYEAPQSSLEPEEKPRVPVQYQQYDTFEVVKVVLIIILVLFEGILGILLLDSFSHAVGIGPGVKLQSSAQMLPYLAGSFCFVGWILWRIRKSNARNHS